MAEVTCSCCALRYENDVKSAIQCIQCGKLFHAKCENVDMTGFHTRRKVWKCKKCVDEIVEKRWWNTLVLKQKQERVTVDTNVLRKLVETVEYLKNAVDKCSFVSSIY